MKKAYLILGIICWMSSIISVDAKHLIVTQDGNAPTCHDPYAMVETIPISIWAKNIDVLGTTECLNYFRIQVIDLTTGIPIGLSDPILGDGWIEEADAYCDDILWRKRIHLTLNFGLLPECSPLPGTQSTVLQYQIVEADMNFYGVYPLYDDLDCLSSLFPYGCFQYPESHDPRIPAEVEVCYYCTDVLGGGTSDNPTGDGSNSDNGQNIIHNNSSTTAEWISSKVLKEEMTVQVYPNPMRDKLTVRINTFEKLNQSFIEIWDVSGRLHKRIERFAEAENGQVTVNTDGFLPGLYYVKVWNGSYQEVFTVTKTLN